MGEARGRSYTRTNIILLAEFFLQGKNMSFFIFFIF